MIKDTNVSCEIESSDADRQILPWGVTLVNPHQSFGGGGRIINVAVIDSGVYANHPDLEGRVIRQHSIICQNDSFDDVAGHGTAVAGIIAAHGNNSPVVGVSQNVAIYSIIVATSEGRVNRDDFVSGIEWAIENDVDIINISLGFARDSDGLRQVIDRAINQGIAVIAASGNTRGLNALYPARYENVISVGSINQSYEISSKSAIGKIDFVAPGVDILSLTPCGGYDLFEGSSFAAAFVTGIVAEYLSYNDIQRDEHTQSAIFNYLISISQPLNDSEERVGNGVPVIEER